MYEPLPVGDMDFRDLTSDQREVAQYALSLKILRKIPDQLSDAEREELFAAMSTSTVASNELQAKLRKIMEVPPTS